MNRAFWSHYIQSIKILSDSQAALRAWRIIKSDSLQQKNRMTGETSQNYVEILAKIDLVLEVIKYLIS